MYVQEPVRVPEYLVVVEVSCWVEPQVQTLLPAAVAVDEDVGLQGDGLAIHVAQELQVHLVVVAVIRFRNQLRTRIFCLNKVTNDKHMYTYKQHRSDQQRNSHKKL